MRRGVTAGTTNHVGWGLRSLTDDDIVKIHENTLDVMERTGIEVDLEEALKIFKQGGCHVNTKTRVVKFPPYVVREALSQCPKKVLFAARNPEHDFITGGREVGFTPFGVGLLTEELDGNVRESTLEDLEAMVRLCDALDTVDMIITPVAPHDIPEATHDLYVAEACLANSSKHFVSEAQQGSIAEKLVEMAKIVAGGEHSLRQRPVLSFGVCPISPLRLPGEAAEVIIVAAKNGIPVESLSMAMAGATSPVSLSGTLVTHNAEVLSGLILAQLVNPGNPVTYGSSTTTFDMRHGTATIGAPEFAMINAALAEMAHFYEVPVTVGGL